MDKYGYTVKRENIRAVFEAVAKTGKFSRSDLSAVSGLSLMTVGKVADSMLEAGIVTQSKENKNAAGRKAGIMELSNDCRILLFDLKTTVFRAVLLDFRLSPVYAYTYSPDADSMTPVSNAGNAAPDFGDFIKKAAFDLFKNDLLSKCVCAGAVCGHRAVFDPEDGSLTDPDIPSLAGIDLRGAASEQFGLPLLCEMPSLEASAAYAYAKTDGSGSLLYAFIGDVLRCVSVNDGGIETGVGCVERQITTDGEFFGEKYKLITSLKNPRLTDELIWELAISLFNCAMLVGCKNICAELDGTHEKFAEKLNSSIKELSRRAEPAPNAFILSGEQGDFKYIAEKARLNWVYKTLM